MFDGPPDPKTFIKNGEEYRRYYISLGSLKPDEKMIDIGSGIGRKAIPLVHYLTPPGEYYGFEIIKRGIDWCQQNISSRYPHFHFHHMDVCNDLYNPQEKIKAFEYRFPLSDAHFDFATLNSVFTHMLPRETKHYLSEVSRLLKKGGRAFVTFFLWNTEAEKNAKNGRSKMSFPFKGEHYFLMERGCPEAAVCYEESYILGLYKKYGLKTEGIHYGSWSGRKNSLTFQDIVIATRV